MRGAPAGDREASYDLGRSRIIGRRAAPRPGGPKYVALAVVHGVDAERAVIQRVLARQQRREVPVGAIVCAFECL